MTTKKFIILAISGMIIWTFFQLAGYFAKEGIRTQNEPKTKVTAEERTSAINACMEGGLTEKVCSCIIDTVTTRYTLAEMQQMNPEGAEAQNIVFECSRPTQTI